MQTNIEHSKQKIVHAILNPEIGVEHVKRCSHCGSVFVNEGECEACGIQFNRDWVGSPLGENSLYSLKQQYEEQTESYAIKFKALFYEDLEITVSYRRKLLRRFQSLLLYLGEKDEEATQEHNSIALFSMEVKDLVEEMMNVGVAFARVSEVLDSAATPQLRKMVYYWLNTIEHQRYSFSLLDFLFNYRILGALRISILLLALALVALASTLAIAFY